jgi:hypothetical protein
LAINPRVTERAGEALGGCVECSDGVRILRRLRNPLKCCADAAFIPIQLRQRINGVLVSVLCCVSYGGCFLSSALAQSKLLANNLGCSTLV